MLVGLGFRPIYAAGLCLVANTAPVAFGAMGIPVLVAGQVSNLAPFHIGQIAGRQLPILAVIVPFWLMVMIDGWRGLKQTFPAALVAGGSFALTLFLTTNFIGPGLPDITVSLVSLIALAAFLKKWQPKEIFTFDGMKQPTCQAKSDYTTGQIIRAWSPFAILTVCVSMWTLKDVKAALSFATIQFEWPALHNLVLKAAPIVNEPIPYAAIFKIDLLGAVGTSILLAAIISAVLLKMKPSQAVETFVETLKELKLSILTIGLVLGFAFVANYSGLSSTLALVLATTSVTFPFFLLFLGWLGVFLTGSDTSANALFGSLQANSAIQLNIAPELTVAANAIGGVTGKMISPQSIAIACAAVGLEGKESDLFRFTIKHSLIFCTFLGLLTVLQAYILPWTMIFFHK